MADTFYIDRGWNFPPSFSKYTKGAEMVTDEEDIRQSLIVLLNTRVGERMFHPDLGSPVYDFVFENLNYTNVTRLENSIHDLVSLYEPRIILNNVSIMKHVEKGELIIKLDYTIPSSAITNAISLAFPLG